MCRNLLRHLRIKRGNTSCTLCVIVSPRSVCIWCQSTLKPKSTYVFLKEKRSSPPVNSVCASLPLSLAARCVRVPLPCVCVSGSLFRGLLRRRLSGFFPPGLPTPPPDPTDPSDGACDLLLHHRTTIATAFQCELQGKYAITQAKTLKFQVHICALDYW